MQKKGVNVSLTSYDDIFSTEQDRTAPVTEEIRSVTQFSTIVFNLLAGLIFLIAVAGLMLGISTGTEAIQMMMVAFVIFVIPHFAEWLLIRIAAANYRLREFIKS